MTLVAEAEAEVAVTETEAVMTVTLDQAVALGTGQVVEEEGVVGPTLTAAMQLTHLGKLTAETCI